MAYEFTGHYDCINCGLIPEDQVCESNDPNCSTGYTCNKCNESVIAQFGPIPNSEDSEDNDEPGFPWLTVCPDSIYAPETHDPKTCKYCIWLNQEK